jgi:NodT family efflux transporter outer membrane factor (OMF) lipoprotein
MAVVACVVLASCKVGSPENRMDEVSGAPGAWTATREAKAGIDDRWVDRFGDASLGRLVAEAYAANGDLRAAAARVERAAALARGAGAASRPQLNASGDAARTKRNFIGFPDFGAGAPSSIISDSYGASLNLSWEIDLWGKVRAGERAAIADLQAQGANYRAARSSLAAQVVRAWLVLAESNEQIDLARQTVKVREDTAGLIRDRFELAAGDGDGIASQLRLAETDVATARAALAEREGDRDRARRQLEILLGRYPAAGLTGSARLPKMPAHPPAGLPSELLLRRPDFVAAERALAASGERRTEAVKAFYPNFSLTGSAGTSSESLGDILDSSFGVWAIAGRAVQPILSGGALQAQLAARTAEEREALANLQQTVLRGFGEVETALAADTYLLDRERALDAAFAMAEDGAKSAERDFALGTGDVLTLLAAQTRRIDLAVQRLMLRRLRLDNRVNLHLALGGDYRIRS